MFININLCLLGLLGSLGLLASRFFYLVRVMSFTFYKRWIKKRQKGLGTRYAFTQTWSYKMVGKSCIYTLDLGNPTKEIGMLHDFQICILS